jgi:uncharacterized protein HemX
MAKQDKGTIQVMAGLIIALLFVTALGVTGFLWQHSEMKRYKEKATVLAAENKTMKDEKVINDNAVATAIKGCEDAHNQCLDQLGQCASEKQVTYVGCPEIEQKSWEGKL